MPLSLTVDSVTPQEVDAYALARGRTVWTDAPASLEALPTIRQQATTNFVSTQ